MRRVVVTGIGIYSCIGKNAEEVTASLRAGKSGIGIDPLRTAYGYRSPLTGLLERPVLKGVLDRRLRVSLPEQGEYAYVATMEALRDARLEDALLHRHQTGLIYGNDSSSKAVIDSYVTCMEKKDTTLLGSGAIFQSMNSTVSMNLATIFQIHGVNMTVSAACASGSHALGLGMMFIRQGLQDVVICGGAQEVNHLSMGSFDGLSAFSTRIDEPEKASRPFDASRDGLVPSGGAATLILEEYEHAVHRGATIYGELTGYGFSSNGGPIAHASAEGSRLAIEMALRDAGLQPSDIDYINAHATSTPHGDACEATALDALFADLRTPISSTKSMTGHECWMAGASEMVYTLLMMKHQFMAPNINFTQPDAYSERLNILTEAVEKPLSVCLSNSFGFGGTNSALIVKKLEE